MSIVDFKVQSHKGEYSVKFVQSIHDCFKSGNIVDCHYLIDKNVAEIYKSELGNFINPKFCIKIEATEDSKSIEKIIPIIKILQKQKIKRNHRLVAIGGGVIQDITCFIASILLRGLEWELIPTTLLAQADSCIGSKSSINIDGFKNILGTFNPPKEILINAKFLETLKKEDIKSGIGEIYKAHAIESTESFNEVANNYDVMLNDLSILERFVSKSLSIKKEYIELDEFDKGVRNIFNYGHSFGHAIEFATNFMIPHGIAVTIGMDMANFIAFKFGFISYEAFETRHKVLEKNYCNYSLEAIKAENLIIAMSSDKKNINSNLKLIMPRGLECKLQQFEIEPNQIFFSYLSSFLNGKFE